jgi:hypothetical protein
MIFLRTTSVTAVYIQVFVQLSTNNEQIDRKCICISHVSHGRASEGFDVGTKSPEARNDSSGPLGSPSDGVSPSLIPENL